MMRSPTIVIAVLLMGCGAENDNTTPALAPSLSITPPSQELLVEVKPNVQCTIYPNVDDLSIHHVLEADSQGLVRFHFRASAPKADDSLGFLDCQNSVGSVSRQELKFAAVIAEQQTLRAKEAAKMAAWRVRLPLTGDLQHLPQSDLARRGFPLRPDSTQDPKAYAEWLRDVSQPAIEAPVSLRPRSGSFHAAQTSSVWAAVEIMQPGSKYDLVSGTWIVPSVTNDFYWVQESSLWVGLDGWNSADVVQDGTDQYDYCMLRNGSFWQCTSGFDAWVEWWPANTVFISNFPVRPQDSIYAQSWVADSSGNANPNGGWGWYYVHNYGTGLYFETKLQKPTGTTFSGNVAEAVLERPDGSSDAAANFGTAYITSFGAWNFNDGNTTTHNFSSDATQIVNMTQNGSGSSQLLVSAQVSNYQTAGFIWHAGE
jgi:hypothetical protein